MVEAAQDRVTAPAPGHGHLATTWAAATNTHHRILILISSLSQCTVRTYETYERPREMRSESGGSGGEAAEMERAGAMSWLQGKLVPTVFTFTLGTRPCYHHHQRLILHNYHTCLLTVCVQCGHREQFHRDQRPVWLGAIFDIVILLCPLGQWLAALAEHRSNLGYDRPLESIWF